MSWAIEQHSFCPRVTCRFQNSILQASIWSSAILTRLRESGSIFWIESGRSDWTLNLFSRPGPLPKENGSKRCSWAPSTCWRSLI
jgi:hypothetical protein